MPCSRNRDVETKDSISYQQLAKVEDNQNAKVAMETNVQTESVLESNKEEVRISNNKKAQKSVNCCRNSKSVEVASGNEVSDVGDVNGSEVTDGGKKDEQPNEPVAIQAEAGRRRSEDKKAVVLQMAGNNANKPPSRRISRSEDAVKYQNELYGKTKAGESKENTPERKKQRKKGLNTEEDIHAVYKNQIESLNTAVQGSSFMEDATLDSQPTVEEESDLLENAEEERKRNKQRVRAKKMKENKHSSPARVMTKLDIAYENAQREIDKVLQPPEKETSMDRKRDKRKKKKKKDLSEMKGEDNEACSSDEKESLETARQKMHKLLDDAFSVISQRKSTIINKVEPSRESSYETNSPPAKDRHLVRIEQMVQTDADKYNEKQHTPIHIYSHGLHEKAGLIPWSPYRAYDDTTLISLSNAETNLNNTPLQQEKFTTATFEQHYSPHSKFYATGPAEPIVIKTKNFEQNIPQSRTTIKPFRQNDRHERPSSINQVTIQNSVYDSTLPSQSSTDYPDSYYDLSSFQEIPKMTPIPRKSVENKAYDNVPGRLKTHDIHIRPEDEVHKPRFKEDSKNYDVVDVITESLQPGCSPQPLINSLRTELQTLSSRRIVDKKRRENAATKPDEETSRTKDSRRLLDRGDDSFGGRSIPATSSSDV